MDNPAYLALGPGKRWGFPHCRRPREGNTYELEFLHHKSVDAIVVRYDHMQDNTHSDHM